MAAFDLCPAGGRSGDGHILLAGVETGAVGFVFAADGCSLWRPKAAANSASIAKMSTF